MNTADDLIEQASKLAYFLTNSSDFEGEAGREWAAQELTKNEAILAAFENAAKVAAARAAVRAVLEESNYNNDCVFLASSLADILK